MECSKNTYAPLTNENEILGNNVMLPTPAKLVKLVKLDKVVPN